GLVALAVEGSGGGGGSVAKVEGDGVVEPVRDVQGDAELGGSGGDLDRAGGLRVAPAQGAVDGEDGVSGAADLRSRAAGGGVEVGAALGVDPGEVGEDVGVEGVVDRRAFGVGAAGGHAGQHGLAPERHEEGAARVAVASVRVRAGRVQGFLEGPADVAGRGGVAGGDLDVAFALEAVVRGGGV